MDDAASADLAPPRGDAEPPFDWVADASMDSFPASDSPSWTGTRLGPPQ